jgi:ATP-dependent helicase/nuclease subunit B
VEKDPGLVARLRSQPFSAHSLGVYLACGRRFYLRYGLGLEEPLQVEEQVSDLDIGKMLHEALRRYHAPHCGAVLPAGDLRGGDIRAVVAALFDERAGGRIGGALLLQRIEMERRLASFVEGYERTVAAEDGLRVLAVEQTIVHEDFHGFTLKGTLDRIEMRGDTHVISDYKKGRRDPDALHFSVEKLDAGSKRELATVLQLGIYALLHRHASGTGMDRIMAQQLSLGVRDDARIAVPLVCRDASFAEGMDSFARTLQSLLEEICDPALPFGPPERLSAACPGCSYRTICGTHWVRGFAP